MYSYPLSSLRAATIHAFHIAPSVRTCEKLARQAKPPAPPTLQTLAEQGRWGRRFRLPRRRNQFFTPRQRREGLFRRQRRGADASESWRSEHVSGRLEIRVIECVEELPAEL